MSATNDDYAVTGYDPDMVMGWDEDAPDSTALDAAVPRVLDDVNYTGDLEADAAAEIDAVAQGFRDRMGREAEREELATESDYWTCLCFATREQRDAFLAAMSWRDMGTRYIDGREVARRANVDLPPDPDWPNKRRSKTWDGYAMTVEENRALTGGDTP